MTLSTASLLYEDNHLLIVNKPAGLPTMGVAEGVDSLLSAAKQYVKDKYNKPGNVYLGIVSRLDAPVSGVVPIARTSKAAQRLTDLFRRHEVEKIYWAVVDRCPEPSAGHLTDYVRKDERHRRMHIAHPGHPQAKEARLSYRLLKRTGSHFLLEIRLETGRKHQIRVQLAQHGCCILGDRKYGSRTKFPRGIALHARRLSFEHPVRRSWLEIEAPLPAAWRSVDHDNGG